MFGTLVFCLPSAHEGGELLLSHNGQRYNFTSSQFQPSFAAWYSDVRHEIKEVTSGYRLVLTYNLVKQWCGSDEMFSASQMLQTYSPLRAALETWSCCSTFDNPKEDSENELIYMLDHQYTDASLSYANLKTSDRARAGALSRFARLFNYNVFLASLESSMYGNCEIEYPSSERYVSDEDEPSEGDEKDFHYIEEELGRDFKLRRVVDLNGTLLVQGINTLEDSILQNPSLEERSPEDEDYEGYTGIATHWYRDSVGKHSIQQA